MTTIATILIQRCAIQMIPDHIEQAMNRTEKMDASNIY